MPRDSIAEMRDARKVFLARTCLPRVARDLPRLQSAAFLSKARTSRRATEINCLHRQEIAKYCNKNFITIAC